MDQCIWLLSWLVWPDSGANEQNKLAHLVVGVVLKWLCLKLSKQFSHTGRKKHIRHILSYDSMQGKLTQKISAEGLDSIERKDYSSILQSLSTLIW